MTPARFAFAFCLFAAPAGAGEITLTLHTSGSPPKVRVEPGQIVAFLGHNGAGKSTTMKVALGLLRPDRGRVVLFGEAGATAKTRARIGYLGEEVGVYPHLNAFDMLVVLGDLFAKVVGAPDELATHVVIRFTSVPQDVRTFLDAAELRYEYQVINRSLRV